MPAAQPPPPTGPALVGREIDLKWSDDTLYTAVVVSYDPQTEQHKLVYKDGSLEHAHLRSLSWTLRPKRLPTLGSPVLEGAVVRFFHPHDARMHEAMVYDHARNGRKLRVAFLDEDATESIRSSAWDFIADSPCLEEGHPVCIGPLGAKIDKDPDHDDLRSVDRPPISKRRKPAPARAKRPKA